MAQVLVSRADSRIMTSASAMKNEPTTQPVSESAAAFAFVSELAQEVSSGKVELPSFPDVAVRVRKVLADEQVSNEQIARIVGSDAGLAAHERDPRLCEAQLGSDYMDDALADVVQRDVGDAKLDAVGLQQGDLGGGLRIGDGAAAVARRDRTFAALRAGNFRLGIPGPVATRPEAATASHAWQREHA